MDGDSQLTAWVLFIIFLTLNFCLYAFDAAFKNLNETELEEKKEKDDKAKKLLDLIEKPRNFLITNLFIHMITILIAGIMLFLYDTQKLSGFILHYIQIPQELSEIIGAVIVGIFFCIIIIGFSIVVPKKLGMKYSKGLAFQMVDFMGFLMKLCYPVTWLITFFSKLILKIFHVDLNADFENVTEDEIKSMVSEGHEKGVLEAGEAKMIANIFEFGDKEAKDIMIHRKNIFALDGEISLNQAAAIMLEANKTRFPVYYDDIDNIIGIINFKDVMVRQHNQEQLSSSIKDIKNLLRKAEFIPETRNIDDLFKFMQSTKTHMVIVVDEYGQTSGIITMEDILEEIVGNIMDEYDEEENYILSQKGNTFVVNGMIPLEEINDNLGIHIDEEEYDTLNGYLISKLDRIPHEDEKPEIVLDGVEYKILSVENKMIALVRITILDKNKE